MPLSPCIVKNSAVRGRNSSEKKRNWQEAMSDEIDKENLPQTRIKTTKKISFNLPEKANIPVRKISKEDFVTSINRVTLLSPAVYEDCEQVRRMTRDFLQKENLPLNIFSALLNLDEGCVRSFMDREGSFEGKKFC